jgi:hypothetical protein
LTIFQSSTATSTATTILTCVHIHPRHCHGRQRPARRTAVPSIASWNHPNGFQLETAPPAVSWNQIITWLREMDLLRQAMAA